MCETLCFQNAHSLLHDVRAEGRQTDNIISSVNGLYYSRTEQPTGHHVNVEMSLMVKFCRLGSFVYCKALSTRVKGSKVHVV